MSRLMLPPALIRKEVGGRIPAAFDVVLLAAMHAQCPAHSHSDSVLPVSVSRSGMSVYHVFLFCGEEKKMESKFFFFPREILFLSFFLPSLRVCFPK